MNTRLSTFTGCLRLLLVSLWLGAAVFFSAVVAPVVFNALRGFPLPNTNEIAGTIVSRALSAVNVSGFAVSLFLLALTVLAERKKLNLTFLSVTLALTLMTLAAAAGHWVVAAKMRGLRLAMVTIDQVPPDDSRRIAFNNLHRYSVLLLTLAMCAAIVAILMTGLRLLRGTGKTSP